MGSVATEKDRVIVEDNISFEPVTDNDLYKSIYNQTKNPKPSPIGNNFGLFAFGGDGGNRNRVRKPIHIAFSGCSQSFGIPSEVRRLTGLLPR